MFFVSCQSERNKISESLIKETCLDCHKDYIGLTGSHDPAKIGCSSCHLGNAKEKDKEKSHLGMVLIPGNLKNAHLTCSSSKCHFNELDRINKSLMTTNSGIISIDKHVFGENPDIDSFFHIKNIGMSAADVHIKNLCANCHLGKEKKNYAVIGELSRGGGCIACHLDYKGKQVNINDKFHPAIDLNIGNEKCFGCHSRSSRISTSYEGWAETDLAKEEIKDRTGKFRVLSDNRVFTYAGNDVHHKAGLLCIDCHSSHEVMGNGKHYKHSSEAVKISCSDCHPPEKFSSVSINNLDLYASLDYHIRKYKERTKKVIITKKDKIPLVNTYFDNKDNPYLISKISQKMHKLNVPPAKCSGDLVHENLDCNMCHSAWAPNCIGCHTEFQQNYKNSGEGKWVELIDGFGFSPPVMGMKMKGQTYKISPAIPGMIMTLDKTGFQSKNQGKKYDFFRLFSPVSPHTTSRLSRSCVSCHNDPSALGYGSGTLKLKTSENSSIWLFIPAYENSAFDGLPQDAWIGFMKDHDYKIKYSARKYFKPLNKKIQTKVLEVGKCIYCHKADKKFLSEMIQGNYKIMLKMRSRQCKI